jgi:hypothetical protein
MKTIWARLRRLFSVFRKSLREMLREWLVLSLSLVFAPLFVILYYLRWWFDHLWRGGNQPG